MILYCINASRCHKIVRGQERPYEYINDMGELITVPGAVKYVLATMTNYCEVIFKRPDYFQDAMVMLYDEKASTREAIDCEYLVGLLAQVEHMTYSQWHFKFCVTQTISPPAIQHDRFEGCYLLSDVMSSREIKSEYEMILKALFDLNYSPILLAHPISIIRALAKKIAAYKKEVAKMEDKTLAINNIMRAREMQ